MATENPLKKISDKLTEETDLQVDGVDVCVTKGPVVDGNEVTLRVLGEDDDDVLLGFDTEAFEEFVRRIAPEAEAGWEVTDEQ